MTTPKPESGSDIAPPTQKPSQPAKRGARVETKNLGRRFGEHTAVENVSLQIEAGECFGLLGANGAGKTTFIRMLTGFLMPSSGTIAVDDLSPAENPRKVQARLGYVPETPRLYPELRVKSFLAFVAGLRGLIGASRGRAIEAVIDRFALEDVAQRPIGHLSKGYCQRISLAQAFLHRPSLVVVDEPTTALDPVQRDEVQLRLAELSGQCTILLCTHDLHEARALTSRTAVLHRGAVVGLGASQELLTGDAFLELFKDGGSVGGGSS